MPITINDVAKEAGVSITTVSRVINNNYPVKKETKERIQEAIDRLNYKPNVMARSLITRKTSVIGIVVPGITNLFFPTIVEAIEENTKKSGYSISLCNTGGDALIEKDLIEDIVAKQVDGIIVIDPSIDNLENGFYENINKEVPVLIVSGSNKFYNCNLINYNEEVGTIEAFKYLLGLGHTRIAFVRGHKSFSYDIKEKIYKEMVKENGLTYENIVNVGRGNSIEVVEKSQLQMESLLCSDEKPTAIFACNDLMAVGVINACNILGLRVPQDISVIGFDNTLVSLITHPKLTTVDLNMKEVGFRAAMELLRVMKGELPYDKMVVLDTHLVIRDSCTYSKN
jgi:LacI family transcriptional regulator